MSKKKIIGTLIVLLIVLCSSLGEYYWYMRNHEVSATVVEKEKVDKELVSKGLDRKDLEHVSNQAYTDLVNESGGRIPDNKAIRSSKFSSVQEYIKNKIKDEYLKTVKIDKSQVEQKVKEMKEVKENKNVDNSILTALAENSIKLKYLNEYSSQLTEEFLNDEENKEKK